MNDLKQRTIANGDSIVSCRLLAREIDKIAVQPKKKVAILSSFTIKGLADCIKVKSYSHDISINIFDGEYNQWRQEILGDKLYEFDPDLIFIFTDFFGMDQDLFFNSKDNSNLDELKDNILGELFDYVNKLKGNTTAKIVISNSVKVYPSLMGVMEGKISSELHKTITDFNRNLLEKTKDDSQVFVFDLDLWLSNVGKDKYWCDKYFYLADMKLSPLVMPFLAEELMHYVVPLFSKKKKCIVLDLDNTIWGGIIGEDGVNGIKLGPENDGKPYYYFQKLLLNFKDRGILLAINSKNNENDVLEVFRDHPYMVLKETDIVAMRVNWDDKASNIRSIAEELNIGLDSMVFIDDDEINISLVNKMIPEVGIIHLPKDPTLYIKTLLDYKALTSLDYTLEDKTRTEMYISDKKRKKHESEALDLNSFLEGLNLKLTIKELDESAIQRSAQLTQKTNQFNLVTNRYHEEDIRDFIKNGHKLWKLEVEDRFGKYGQVGLCIVKDLQDHFEIDTLLLSCRVLGRKIENEFIGYILRELKRGDKKKVKAIYRPTDKNMQVRDFYSIFNFTKTDSNKEKDIWELDLRDFEFNHSNFVNILNN